MMVMTPIEKNNNRKNKVVDCGLARCVIGRMASKGGQAPFLGSLFSLILSSSILPSVCPPAHPFLTLCSDNGKQNSSQQQQHNNNPIQFNINNITLERMYTSVCVCNNDDDGFGAIFIGIIDSHGLELRMKGGTHATNNINNNKHQQAYSFLRHTHHTYTLFFPTGRCSGQFGLDFFLFISM